MSQQSKVEEREALLMALGMLVDPCRRHIFGDGDVQKAVPHIRAQFLKDLEPTYKEQIRSLAQHSGLYYENEYRAALFHIRDLSKIFDALKKGHDREWAQKEFHAWLDKARQLIRAIPCDDPGTILAASSPYDAYIRLRAMFGGARKRLDVLDPYLSAETFHRYLPEVPDGVSLTVVTSGKIMDVSGGQSKLMRRDAIVAVSELLAQQYPSRYRFLVSESLHDRHIRVDDEILHLGGSTKDAGRTDYFTISHLDPEPASHATLDAIIAEAEEWFGPTIGTHRRS